MSRPAKKLTPKQQRFVDEYLVDLNATAAALRAGYSAKTAYAIGGNLLSKIKVKAAIQKAMDERSVRTQIQADRVLEALANNIDFDPRKLFDAEGNPKPVSALDDKTASALASVKMIKRQSADDTPEYVYEFKAWDKTANIHLAMKHLGLLTERIQMQANYVVEAPAESSSDAEWEAEHTQIQTSK